MSLKKQRSVKKTAAEEKPAKKPAQKAKKSKVVEKVVEAAEEDTIDVPDVSDAEEEESKEVQVLVTELDSGDEDITEGDNVFQEGQDVGTIPDVSSEVQKAAKGPSGEPGVVYLGRVPHGFYEHEMRSYFSQFGPINRLRLSRNKKTGASKHYAFVEFAEASTAEIVSKTMDNYLLFGHVLKCRVIPKDQVHEDLFKGANRRYKHVPSNKMNGKKLEKPRTKAAWEGKVTREQNKRAIKAAKLKEIGYDFEMPDIKSVPAPAAIENGETEVKAIEASPAEIEETKEVEKPAAIEEAEPEVVEEEAKVEVKTRTRAASKSKVAKGKAAKGKGRKAKA